MKNFGELMALIGGLMGIIGGAIAIRLAPLTFFILVILQVVGTISIGWYVVIVPAGMIFGGFIAFIFSAIITSVLPA